MPRRLFVVLLLILWNCGTGEYEMPCPTTLVNRGSDKIP